GAQRDRRPTRAAYVDVSQRASGPAELWLELQDDAVLVELGEHRRHLPLAERVVERVVDHLGAHAQPGGGGAVDDQGGREPLVLLIAAHVDELRARPQRLDQPRGPAAGLLRLRILEARLAP